jgi:hypothetical protein
MTQRHNTKLKIFILLLTIAVFVLPFFVLWNLIQGRAPFDFF